MPHRFVKASLSTTKTKTRMMARTRKFAASPAERDDANNVNEKKPSMRMTWRSSE
jgi:hypothetical protein